MTFFYDINKRLADIDTAKKPQQRLNEGAVIPRIKELDEIPEVDSEASGGFNFSGTEPGDFSRMAQSQGGKAGSSFVSTEPGDLARAFKPQGSPGPGGNDLVVDSPDEDLKEMMRLSGLSEDDMEEGNEFSGALDAARKSGAKTFDVDGQTYPVKEGTRQGARQGTESESEYDARMRRLTASPPVSPERAERLSRIPGWSAQMQQALDHVKKHPKKHPKKQDEGVAEGIGDELDRDPKKHQAHIEDVDRQIRDAGWEKSSESELPVAYANMKRARGWFDIPKGTFVYWFKKDNPDNPKDPYAILWIPKYNTIYVHTEGKTGRFETYMPNDLKLVINQGPKQSTADTSSSFDADEAKKLVNQWITLHPRFGGYDDNVRGEMIRIVQDDPVGRKEYQDEIKKAQQSQGVAEGKARKPDFPDIDKDGNTTEPISRAAKDAAKRKIAGKRYGGAAQQDDRDDQEPSRGPGRPEEGGPKHTYDAPFGRVNIPAWKGPRTVHKIGDAEPGKEAPRRGRPKKIGEQQDDMIDIVDRGEYDREGDMAHDQLRTILDAAEELRSILTADENLPEWVQSKITKALDYIDTARDYMKSQKSGETEPVTEKAVSVKQRRAAGIAHAAQKGKIPKEELRGASKEMAKMPKGELKKFANTKETGLPEKVKETTTSGSVATSDVEAKPKKSKGGVSFGKGIYDSWNRELEVMIAESMDITVNQHTQDDGSIKKTITVNATDEDAEQLAQLLNLAGMDQHDDMHDDHMYPVYHQDPCECAEIVDENSPDWPTSTEYNDDPLQYSGGLNRPKSTGQTTVPVIASQFSRQMSESNQSEVDELDRIRLLLGK